MSTQANQEVTGDEVEEINLRGDEKKTVRVNRLLPDAFKKALS